MAAHISLLTRVSMHAPTHAHTHTHKRSPAQTKMSGEVICRQITTRMTRSKYYLYLDIYLWSTFRRRRRASSVFLALLLQVVKQKKKQRKEKGTQE